MKNKNVSPAVIKRLPRYYRYLENMMEEGVERTSSGNLSQIMKITASQMRQDLNQFGGFGYQGYGYGVTRLHDEIGKILNIDKVNDLIIVGAGNLGKCLSNYSGFQKYGFHIQAVFDKDPDVVGTDINGITVLPMEKIEDVVKENDIHIAALCIPKSDAQEVADKLIEAGIDGIWNFAAVDLDVPDDVSVENMFLLESLMCLCYGLGANEKPQPSI